MDQEEEIRACTTRSEKVSMLLLNISGPLEDGDSKGFYTMLKIMKNYGVDATQRLADRMITRVRKLNLDNTSPTISLSEDRIKGKQKTK